MKISQFTVHASSYIQFLPHLMCGYGLTITLQCKSREPGIVELVLDAKPIVTVGNAGCVWISANLEDQAEKSSGVYRENVLTHLKRPVMTYQPQHRKWRSTRH